MHVHLQVRVRGERLRDGKCVYCLLGLDQGRERWYFLLHKRRHCQRNSWVLQVHVQIRVQGFELRDCYQLHNSAVFRRQCMPSLPHLLEQHGRNLDIMHVRSQHVRVQKWKHLVLCELHGRRDQGGRLGSPWNWRWGEGKGRVYSSFDCDGEGKSRKDSRCHAQRHQG